MNLMEFHEWCKEHSISWKIFYSEAENNFEVETVSAAKSEETYYKKLPDNCFDWIVEKIKKQIEQEILERTQKPEQAGE